MTAASCHPYWWVVIEYPALALTQPNLTSEKDESRPKDMEVVT